MKPQTQSKMLTVLIASVLTACSSGGGSEPGAQKSVILNTVEDDRPGLIVTGLDGRSAESVDIRWLVNLTTYRIESRTPGSGYVSAGLLEYDQLSMLGVIDFYEPNSPAVGECDILIEESTGGGGTGSGGGGSAPPRVSGGESLSIDTPDGVWMTMASNGEVAPTYVTSEDGLVSPIPENATLTIPGSTSFPAVKLYPIQEPDAPVRLSPAFDEWANPDDIYSWMPSNKDGETMGLSFYGYAFADGSFIERIADCIVVDDGNFEMPDDLLLTLNNYNGLLDVGYFRRTKRVDLVDDMVFLQRSTVAE